MKKQLLLCSAIALFIAGSVNAQTTTTRPVEEETILTYQQALGDFAIPYNGKEESAYQLNPTNHPYWQTSEFIVGDLWYNHILYKQVAMRLNIHRDELVVLMPGKPFNIVLEKEKFNRAVLHGQTIIPSQTDLLKNAPSGDYHILLHEGLFPIIKSYFVSLEEKIADRVLEHTFRVSEKIYVCKEGTCHPVAKKSSLLKLFPDKKKELETYIKQHKLKFNKKKREESIVQVVNYYETIL
ncbi:hypothetical protein M2480_001148 [Parabacteroides sp. PFB2-12]|uniref:hypothetical protein n=1 Tax=unclassified Parabacteroides TaxID=2649774 RepID=UPI002473A3DC|nr:MULTISPECIES: hypothetical protein [unclassified Parabacteroides]MDH6342526.1 hypothetical protein [Parabacteroides sp. PM6-13]MDH6390178.1 hypothetical protein [Parabacteroides sp. PFB2-12]